MKNILYFMLIISTILNSSEGLDIGDDLLSSLDEVSELATKSKLNIDDTPSFVTVLCSSKLKKLGVSNVFEALSLVPGVQLKKEASGVPIVVFRGLDEKGEVKLMVDGVVINNHYRGSSYYYLDFPIEMIRRIEVIRGASSGLYGSNAMSGVINIITHSSQDGNTNNIFTSFGSNKQVQGGAFVSTKIQDVKIALDSYYQKSNKTIFVGANPTLQQGDSDRHLKDYSVGLNISSEHFTLLSRIKKSSIGNAYGLFQLLDTNKDKYANKNQSIFTQLSYKNQLNYKAEISMLVGYNNYQQGVETINPRAGILNTKYEEESYFTQIDYASQYFNNNKLLIGARYESAKTIESRWALATRYMTPISNPNFTRRISSLYLEDTYSPTTDLDILAGLRYDDFSDVSDNISPNLGVVYRLNKKIKLKAKYSNAFRVPSWIELTNNSSLKPEKSNTLEAGVIFKYNQQNTLRTNFYTFKIEDRIDKEGRNYVQSGKSKFYGVEFEYLYMPFKQLEIDFFASYIHAKDYASLNKHIPEIANILASTFLTYEMDSGIILGSLLKYVSSSKRDLDDTRKEIRDSFIFDQTISYIYKDFTASLIFKDLFNTNTNYALAKNNYKQDFDDGGRTVLIKLSLDF